MDVNILREAVTVLSFAGFIGIVAYAALPANRERFEEAARMPLDDEETAPSRTGGGGAERGTRLRDAETGR